MCSLISYDEVKTRKPHRCGGCTQQIEKGTTVLRTTSTDAGEIASAYWCAVCVKKPVEQDCYAYGDLAHEN